MQFLEKIYLQLAQILMRLIEQLMELNMNKFRPKILCYIFLIQKGFKVLNNKNK